eukprot:sb/3466411/
MTMDNGTVYAEANTGDSVTFTCFAVRPAELSSDPTVTWNNDNGDTLTGTSSVSNEVLTSTLIISDPSIAQDTYTCSVTYPDYKDYVLSVEKTLKTLGFYTKPEDSSAQSGSTFTLTCITSAPVAHVISWEGYSATTSTFNSITGTQTSTLVVSDFQTTTVYTCSASYESISLSTTATVTLSNDGIISQTADQNVDNGELVQLNCTATTGSGFSGIAWYNEGAEITSGTTSTTGSGTVTLTLEFSSVSISDQGDYTCNVTYSTYNDIHSTTLNIYDNFGVGSATIMRLYCLASINMRYIAVIMRLYCVYNASLVRGYCVYNAMSVYPKLPDICCYNGVRKLS